MKTFEELKLSPTVAQAIGELGYVTLTPIQAVTLPILLGEKTDFLGLAATGTGKTAAFGIPMLEKINPESKATQGLILCPTRELSVQVAEAVKQMARYRGIHVQAIYGGAGYGDQLRGIKRGAQIIVATPGRLVDHINQKNISLNEVQTVVLDEADEMISMGFKDDLEFLLSQVSRQECQRWLFSATMSPTLKRVADTYLSQPKTAKINQTEMLPGTVKQVYYTVREKNKARGLCKIIEMADDFYGLIFCQTKVLVIGLTEYLRSKGYEVDCLHGDKTQSDRERTLKAFKERLVNIVVCSDVAARGLDVKELTHVINYSLPHDFDSYVHRIGRTGRSGKTGTAISLVSPAQMHLIERLERMTKSKMENAIFPTRREVSLKKLSKELPKFMSAKGLDKAAEILSPEWKTAMKEMSKEEIATRFLALSHPDWFDESQQSEEVHVAGQEEEREPRQGRSRHRQFGRGPQRGMRERREGRGGREGHGGPRKFGKPAHRSFRAAGPDRPERSERPERPSRPEERRSDDARPVWRTGRKIRIRPGQPKTQQGSHEAR